MTNKMVFGPDGNLYFNQGAMASLGQPDAIWGNRAEHPLTANILKLNVSKLGSTPLNVKTKDGGGSYDPFAAGAPLTIFAQGVRNAYDLVWHSNGNLYAPTNGSAAGGNTPLDPKQPGTKLTNVRDTEHDWLFRIPAGGGGYYGHPNPTLGHYILNGGNPTSGADKYEEPSYPVGTKPDPNWRP